ncbi:MAG: ATP-binding cassette domain-containing protein, partial [Burkholderiales bacterium]
PEMLERVYALFPRLKERRRQRAGTLSGGERQMLALGRALMGEPSILLLDEPSLGLAPSIVEALYETLGRLHEQGLTLLIAEQSIQLALEVADYAYVLQTGRTVLDGTAERLAGDPQVRRVYLGLEAGGADG